MARPKAKRNKDGSVQKKRGRKPSTTTKTSKITKRKKPAEQSDVELTMLQTGVKGNAFKFVKNNRIILGEVSIGKEGISFDGTLLPIKETISILKRLAKKTAGE